MARILRTILISTVVLVSGVAHAGNERGQRTDDPATNRARPFVEGQAALAQYVLSNDCENSDAANVEADIAELEESVSMFHTIRMRNYESEQRSRHTTLSFEYADAALAKGCLDEANEVYRAIIIFYTGATYSGIRDRARLGVDDVRAERMMRR